MPGFVPTKMVMRLGSRISRSLGRCAYFEGGAYLLGCLRRLAGVGDGNAGSISLSLSGRLRFIL
jgi:hypothetical protein